MPSDVTGLSIFNQKKAEFEFRPGPIIAQIVLADEINRATPKTQCALLECMEERQLTIDGVTHPLPSPFIVLATQNPIEYEGTFPLPEAQLDRFLLRVRLGYPSEGGDPHPRRAESPPPDRLGGAGAGPPELRGMQAGIKESTSTRPSPTTSSGSCAPRASITTSTSAPARAARWRCFAPHRRTPRSGA